MKQLRKNAIEWVADMQKALKITGLGIVELAETDEFKALQSALVDFKILLEGMSDESF